MRGDTMAIKNRSRRNRDVRPVLLALEERALLNGTMPKLTHHVKAAAHVASVKQQSVHQTTFHPSDITVINTTSNKGFHFINFDGPNGGTAAGMGTNMNGISNAGTAIGFTIGATGNFTNFSANLTNTGMDKVLTNPATKGAMALGINSTDIVVGTDGNGNAFFLDRGVVKTFIPPGGTSATAFGINDHNTIVGQYVTSTATPGFIRVNSKSFITINAPAGPNVVNAQSINNNGLVVGFYLGTDGQVHGFTANEKAAKNGVVTGTPVADPTIPAVPGEPGATFVFSQILGINDHGIAVGYYGDSTTSQHGFLYNTKTGAYTFLDDPSEAFNNGVEVTQVTGITNSGEITGFYSDATGVFHGFVATAPRG